MKKRVAAILVMILLVNMFAVLNITAYAESDPLSYDAAVAYKKVVDEAIEKYGEFDQSSYTGVGLVRLIDFDGNGNMELLLGYSQTYAVCEVYGYNGTTYKMCEIDCSNYMTGEADFIGVEYGERIYIITYEYGAFSSKYHVGTVRNGTWIDSVCYQGPVVEGDYQGEYVTTYSSEILTEEQFEEIFNEYEIEDLSYTTENVVNGIARIDSVINAQGQSEPNNTNEIKSAYIEKLQEVSEEVKKNYETSAYYVYDINKDNIPELIIKRGTCEADYRYDVFTYMNSEALFIGELPGGHISLCSVNESGILLYCAHMGYEMIFEGSMSNNKISHKKIYEEDCSGKEYTYEREIGKFRAGAKFLEACRDISDFNLLKQYFDSISTEENLISIILDGKKLKFDQPPVMRNDRVLVPVRAVFEALGATVEWDENTQTVTSTKGSTTITMRIGEYSLNKNGVEIGFDVPSQIINERTLVPVRAVAEAMGTEVTWDDESQTVYIDSSPKVNAIIINADKKQTANDAAFFRQVLLKNKLGKIKEDNLQGRYEPTQKELEMVVNYIVRQAGEDDITYFFYSGHGSDDGSIYPTYSKKNMEGSYAVTPWYLIELLKQVPGTVVIFLNSCYSGKINTIPGVDKNKFKIITSSEGKSGIGKLDAFEDENMGFFTEALLNGLGGLEGDGLLYNTITGRDGTVKADYNNDRNVTLAELFKYIDENMDKKYRNKDGDIVYQNPTCSNESDNTVIYSY